MTSLLERMEMTKRLQRLPRSFNKKATLVENLNDALKDWRKNCINDELAEEIERRHGCSALGIVSRNDAERIFVERDVKVIGGYGNEYLFPDQGVPHTVLIGIWKYRPDSRLYVRFGQGIALQSGEDFSGYDNWAYMFRGDCKEKGFFNVQGNIVKDEIMRAYQLVQKFTDTLEAYATIARARR